MNKDQLDWLASLARMKIRAHQRSLAKFATRPGQDPAEAQEIRERQAARLAWEQETLVALSRLRRRAGEQIPGNPGCVPVSEGIDAITQARFHLASGAVPRPDTDLALAAMELLAAADADPRLERLALAGALIAELIDQHLEVQPT